MKEVYYEGGALWEGISEIFFHIRKFSIENFRIVYNIMFFLNVKKFICF